MAMIQYDRARAVAYAHMWAMKRNPAYYDFSEIGGDCTNFASQCVYAGAGVMNYTPVYGWFYNTTNNRTASWTGVEYFYNFMVRKDDGPGPIMEHVSLANVEPGDIIQLKFTAADGFQHSPVVVAVGNTPAPGNILLAAHTIDSDNRPLNTYKYIAYRALHIIGVRI